MPLFGLAWQTEPKRRDSSLSRGLPYVNDVMGFLPFAYLMFFPFLDFPCSFSRMINILKAIDESSSQHGIAVTYLHTEERSWVFSSIGQFLKNLFFIYGGRDNFVTSFPSSTAHFNWIPHEFSVVLPSCLCIKLRAVPAHLYFVNTIGVTHFNTLVRFVSVSLRPLLSHQSTNYPTRTTVTFSRRE